MWLARQFATLCENVVQRGSFSFENTYEKPIRDLAELIYAYENVLNAFSEADFFDARYHQKMDNAGITIQQLSELDLESNQFIADFFRTLVYPNDDPALQPKLTVTPDTPLAAIYQDWRENTGTAFHVNIGHKMNNLASKAEHLKVRIHKLLGHAETDLPYLKDDEGKMAQIQFYKDAVEQIIERVPEVRRSFDFLAAFDRMKTAEMDEPRV